MSGCLERLFFGEQNPQDYVAYVRLCLYRTQSGTTGRTVSDECRLLEGLLDCGWLSVHHRHLVILKVFGNDQMSPMLQVLSVTAWIFK